MMKFSLCLLMLFAGDSGVAAFSTSPAPTKSAVRLFSESPSPETSTEAPDETSSEGINGSTKRPSTIYVPLSFDEMVKQISSTMEDASKVGKKRQIIRMLLPRAAGNENLGVFYETDVVDPDPDLFVDTILVPPDETWQGGIMQLYRSASLACQEILRYVVRNQIGNTLIDKHTKS